jgi:hypothetical protein
MKTLEQLEKDALHERDELRSLLSDPRADRPHIEQLTDQIIKAAVAKIKYDLAYEASQK